MIYYIVGIQHSITMGGISQTVLTLKYGRKPWEVLPEIFDYTHRAGPNFTATGKRYVHVPSVAENRRKDAKVENESVETGRAREEVSMTKMQNKNTDSDATTGKPNIDEDIPVTDTRTYTNPEGVPRDSRGKPIILFPPDTPWDIDEGDQ